MTEYEIDELARAIAEELRMRRLEGSAEESAPRSDTRADERVDVDFDS